MYHKQPNRDADSSLLTREKLEKGKGKKIIEK